MSQYIDTHCILCGKTQLMAMTENVICNACEETSAPADEIVKLRKQVAELREVLSKVATAHHAIAAHTEEDGQPEAFGGCGFMACGIAAKALEVTK